MAGVGTGAQGAKFDLSICAEARGTFIPYLSIGTEARGTSIHYLSICTEARGTSIQGLTTLGCFSSSSTISPAVGRLVGVWEKHVRSNRALGKGIYPAF